MSSAESNTRRAVIDIGTNSVKLLVADVSGESVDPVFEIGEQTRLGRGFYETHLLQKEAIELTASVVSRFSKKALELGAAAVRPFATSAARDARNGNELVSAIRSASGLELTVISGDTEAEWAFQGAGTNPRLQGHEFLLVDVGGGSAEFILGNQQKRVFSASFPLGTVRTIEAHPHGNPPTPEELAVYRNHVTTFLESQVQPRLAPHLPAGAERADRAVTLAGTGGTASILGMMQMASNDFDRDALESLELDQSGVSGWVERLWGLSLEQRQQVPGLPPARADVMLAGVVIFECIMKTLQFSEFRISTRGVRFAALRALWGD